MSINVAIVIPAYREALYIEKTLTSIEKSISYAAGSCPAPYVIVVANNPQTVAQQFVTENQQMIRMLKDLQPSYNFVLDILDYTDPGLRFGVGEARKLGMEYAIAKYLSDPLDRLVSLDADTIVNEDYIHSLFTQRPKAHAFTIDFEHPLHNPHMVLYELYLRYLAKGLHIAGSPFDFIAIGSAMGVTVEAYQKCGGMPAKSATEDFHFLNKLRLRGPIVSLPKAKVYPSDRTQSKTTLGTGVFLEKSKQSFTTAFSSLLLPSPVHFQRLRRVLSAIHEMHKQESLLSLLEQIHEKSVYEHLRTRGIPEKLFQIMENTNDPTTFQNRSMEVIDGLETIRLLRYMKLQDNSTVEPLDLCRWAMELKNQNLSKQTPLEILQLYRETSL